MYRKVQFSILVLILALTGCKTTGVNKADKTVQVMNKKFATLKSGPDRITAVTDSLNELVKKGGDMRAEFKTFDRNVNNLISLRNRFNKLNADVKSSKSAFIEAWAESQLTMSNDELRARAKKRRSEVVSRFDELDEFVSEAKAKFEPWLQEVLDIRNYLESDLNANGIASIEDVASQISKKAVPVKSKIDELITELDQLSNEITAPKLPKEKDQ